MKKDLKSCELCGKKDNLQEAIIEGSMLSVCKNCLSFGKAVILPKAKEEKKIPKKIEIEKTMELINEDFQNIIKKEREKLNLTQEELAKRLNEKESVIHHLESGELEPSLILAKKLENLLHVNLIEIYEEKQKTKISLSDPTLTIGDLLKLKKRR